jgi:hypothetical protein
MLKLGNPKRGTLKFIIINESRDWKDGKKGFGKRWHLNSW